MDSYKLFMSWFITRFCFGSYRKNILILIQRHLDVNRVMFFEDDF